MSIFDQDIQINHELLIENGWEERHLYHSDHSESEPNYHCYTLHVTVKPLRKFRWFSPTVWFLYDPRTQIIEFLESKDVKPQKVSTMSDINVYIQFTLNHFNYIDIK